MGLENPIHLMIVLVVVLMVFGAKRLPEMGRSLGDGMRGFKDALSGQSPSAQAMTAHGIAPATVITPAATVVTPSANVIEPIGSAVDEAQYTD
jgi:sec-independent protein translocase protein TatA